MIIVGRDDGVGWLLAAFRYQRQGLNGVRLRMFDAERRIRCSAPGHYSAHKQGHMSRNSLR